MSGKKQTTFAKQQRERARMERAAEKRKRRQDRARGADDNENDPSVPLLGDPIASDE